MFWREKTKWQVVRSILVLQTNATRDLKKTSLIISPLSSFSHTFLSLTRSWREGGSYSFELKLQRNTLNKYWSFLSFLSRQTAAAAERLLANLRVIQFHPIPFQLAPLRNWGEKAKREEKGGKHFSLFSFQLINQTRSLPINELIKSLIPKFGISAEKCCLMIKTLELTKREKVKSN